MGMMDEGRWVDNVTSLPTRPERRDDTDTVLTRADSIPEVPRGGLDIHSINQRRYGGGMRDTP